MTTTEIPQPGEEPQEKVKSNDPKEAEIFENCWEKLSDLAMNIPINGTLQNPELNEEILEDIFGLSYIKALEAEMAGVPGPKVDPHTGLKPSDIRLIKRDVNGYEQRIISYHAPYKDPNRYIDPHEVEEDGYTLRLENRVRNGEETIWMEYSYGDKRRKIEWGRSPLKDHTKSRGFTLVTRNYWPGPSSDFETRTLGSDEGMNMKFESAGKQGYKRVV